MIYMTLMYIAYLNYYSNIHLTKGGKVLEIANESMFIVISYHFVLLNGLINDFNLRILIGNVLIGYISALLLLNLIFISVVSLKPSIRKCKLKHKKKKKLEKLRKKKEKRL